LLLFSCYLLGCFCWEHFSNDIADCIQWANEIPESTDLCTRCVDWGGSIHTELYYVSIPLFRRYWKICTRITWLPRNQCLNLWTTCCHSLMKVLATLKYCLGRRYISLRIVVSNCYVHASSSHWMSATDIEQ
jgi:hypothetical protein